jgi:NAD(P)-dependent dehydrogenase (short-subunit alcohol dehydrogenase family)
MTELEGKVALITGGCGDIGRATAGRLLERGARVALLDVGGAEKAAAVGPPDRVLFIACDVSDRAAVGRAIDAIIAKWGRLDFAIANAAVVQNQPFLEITPEAFAQTLNVNLMGCFHVAQLAARVMNAQQPDAHGVRGKILFTGSWVQDLPWPEGTSYIVSKAGIKALARNMAQELAARGIRVNVVAPGIVMAGLSKQVYETDPAYGPRATAAIPLGEFGTADQVADAFAFMCGPASNYMTGSVLLVDGGCSLVKR